jgi:hypothetical protein
MLRLPLLVGSPRSAGGQLDLRHRRIGSSRFTGELPNAVGLINAYRADRPTFWRRTRDDWAGESVMLLIGAVVGGVIGYWVNTLK